jgi:DNA modification methylase
MLGSPFELAWTNKKACYKMMRIKHTGFHNADESERRERFHPTQKPVALVSACLELFQPKHVIDGFCGSGSTLIACEKTNRKYYGMEIDPHYCDVIIKRWEEYTGKKAELIK